MFHESFDEQVQRTEERYKNRRIEREKKSAAFESIGKESAIKAYQQVEGRKRIDARLSYLDINDGLGKERILGTSDLLEVNYLEIGEKTSMPVCRIEVRSVLGQVLGHGTGFMISPALLMTNNHVLSSIEDCRRSMAQFNYESDVNFLPKDSKSFLLDPDRFFYTDNKLDFTLVAVKPSGIDGTPLSKFGYLKLYSEPGKALFGEYVSLIEHPKGGLKCVVIRENKIVDFLDDFVHYVADTEPGSSGSPVFNDQWQLVALHHSGVPKRDNGKILARSGVPWEPGMGEDEIAWVANEGVRISRILDHLGKIDDATRAKLKEFLFEFPAESGPAAVSGEGEIELGELDPSTYVDKKGYDANFLGERVPLPDLAPSLQTDRVPLTEGDGFELKYTHFSVVMSQSRRLAFFTAVNIDGNNLKDIERSKDKWYYDPRIDRKYQSGPKLYSNNELDRGHLVRRRDPDWGELAEIANVDTFHFTNCAPQHSQLNQHAWAGLEDYILRNAKTHGLHVTVFTGPVFMAHDLIYREEFRIPAEYWKVAVIVKDDGKLSATAYLQTQKNLIVDLEFAYGKYRTYQVPVAEIEKLTGLDFGDLRDSDPIQGLEGAIARVIENPDDLVL